MNIFCQVVKKTLALPRQQASFLENNHHFNRKDITEKKVKCEKKTLISTGRARQGFSGKINYIDVSLLEQGHKEE